ncbi:SusC/RagA family TonB-linked outer membrane protein [Parabacteroides pacaensis]|uniref:SusC/RagA family TonB-linked outer membrane protein n=1 Tax=Parabacteroides pacaensis TaxID=2086575 RepID=UPI000D0E9FEE|nr:SusC/RagA family TonB-linked outer membrane protein [Parabacteroides pacaensis]
MKNIKIQIVLAYISMILPGLPLYAKDIVIPIQVKGIVTNEFDEPLPGVWIQTENGQNEYLTDTDGTYTLNVKDGSKYAVFSLAGYEAQKVEIRSGKEINVQMAYDAAGNDDWVDMGYLSLPAQAVTGAVSSVSGEQLGRAPVANLSLILAGQLPGLTTIESNSELSRGGADLFVRGISTTNGRAPLVVIDGVICPNTNYEYISPREIESITLLKDASTTALYGIQGANGVIVITTKRGHTGKTQVNVWYDQSFQQMTKEPMRLNSWEYAELRNQAGANDGMGAYSQFSKEAVEKFRAGDDPLYPNNDYYKMYMKPVTLMERAAVNITGGTDVIRYFTNVNFMHQGLPFKTAKEPGSKYDPTPRNNWVNFRANVDLKINNYLSAFARVSGNIKTEKTTQYGNSTIYNHLFNLPPTLYGPLTPVITDREDPNFATSNQVITHTSEDLPVYGMLNRSGYTSHVVTNIIAQAGLNLDMSFITQGLSLKGLMAYQTNSVNGLTTHQDFERWVRTDDPDKLEFKKKGSNNNTPLSYGKGSSFYYNINLFANVDYKRTFGDHSIQAMAYLFFLNQEKEKSSGASILPYKRESMGITATYGFRNRYYIRGDWAYSGSEQFHRDHRYISTPSVGVAWIASREAFLQEVKWLSNLKLRASYGISANDQLGDTRFLYLDDIRATDSSITEGLIGNPDVTAEKMKKQNYGIDLGLFNQFSVSFDYYKSRCDNMLISGAGSVPQYQGVELGNYAKVNTGSMENKGFEFVVDYRKHINKDWFVSAGMSLSKNSNTVINVNESPYSDEYAYRYRSEGYRYGQQWGYVIDKSNGNGFFNSEDELKKSGLTYAIGTPRVGDFIYKDLNNDQVIDEKDIAPIGNSWLPKYYYSISGAFTYKQFEFSFLFQGAGKASTAVSGIGAYENYYQGVFNDIHLKAWTPERYANGEEILYPALSLNETTSHRANSYFIMDRSYIRLKNIELAYSLPLKTSKVIFAEKIRFSVAAQNLFTIDNMRSNYIDPEVASMGNFQPYRVYNIGVSLLF